MIKLIKKIKVFETKSFYLIKTRIDVDNPTLYYQQHLFKHIIMCFLTIILASIVLVMINKLIALIFVLLAFLLIFYNFKQSIKQKANYMRVQRNFYVIDYVIGVLNDYEEDKSFFTTMHTNLKVTEGTELFEPLQQLLISLNDNITSGELYSSEIQEANFDCFKRFETFLGNTELSSVMTSYFMNLLTSGYDRKKVTALSNYLKKKKEARYIVARDNIDTRLNVLSLVIQTNLPVATLAIFIYIIYNVFDMVSEGGFL